MDNIQMQLNNVKDEYYKKNKKVLIEKNKQKRDCALQVVEKFGIDNLVKHTIRFVENDVPSHKIYIDYLIFKRYACPEYYNQISDHLIELIKFAIHKYKQFELHINLDSFTISALERYRDMILIFEQKCAQYDIEIFLTSIQVYNSPGIMNSIIQFIKQFLTGNAHEKIVFYNKTDSVELLKNVLKN